MPSWSHLTARSTRVVPPAAIEAYYVNFFNAFGDFKFTCTAPAQKQT